MGCQGGHAMGCQGGSGGYGTYYGGNGVMPSTASYYYGADGMLYYYGPSSTYQGAAPPAGAIIEERGRVGEERRLEERRGTSDIPAPKPADKRPSSSDRPLKEDSDRAIPPPTKEGGKSPDRQP